MLCSIWKIKKRQLFPSNLIFPSHLSSEIWGFYCNRCGSDTLAGGFLFQSIRSCGGPKAPPKRLLDLFGDPLDRTKGSETPPWKATELGWLERLERLTCQATKKAEALKLLKDEAWRCCGCGVLGIWCGLCGTARKLSSRMLRERERTG